MCENLVKDLKIVASIVKPCFPQEFDVMNLYVSCYEEVIMERLNKILQDMEQIVKREPPAVLTFNKFLQVCKEVQEQLRIQVHSF